MIGYFPEPYPDELLYSLCARFSDRTQYPGTWTMTQALFGKKGTIAVVDLPRHLGFLADVLPPDHPCKAVDRLIDEHTLLPFYGPFLPVERLESVRKGMGESNGATPYSRAGLSGALVQRPAWLRFCPLCVEEDRECFEECYWHRIHQVPGVEVCPIHEIPLENSRVRSCNSRFPYTFVSAERAIQNVVASSQSFSVSVHGHLLDIAYDAAWLLAQRGLSEGTESLCQRYRSLLADRGLAAYTGIVKTSALVESFKTHYPPEFLALVRCEIDEQINQHWMARLPREGHTLHHPLRHLLLIHFLGHTVNAFFELPIDPRPFGSGPWPCLNHASAHFGQMVIREYQLTFDTRRRPVGTFACSCGFVYSRTGPDRSAEDRFQAHCCMSYGPVWEDKLRQLWEDPNVSPTQAEKQLGTNRKAIIRQAARLGLAFPPPGCLIVRNSKMLTAPHISIDQLPDSGILDERRAEWLSIIQENPEAGRTVLRRRWPTLHSWLQKHDREWLDAHLPPRKMPVDSRTRLPPPRVDWAERDEQLVSDVKVAVQHLMHSPDRPQRITVDAIARQVGKLLALRSVRAKLPLTSKVLAELVETHEAFVVRRIWWAAGLYHKENIHPSRCQLMARANVRTRYASGRPAVQEAIETALQMLNQNEQ